MDIFYPTQPRAPPFRGIFGAVKGVGGEQHAGQA
jgi:hypothetical protein